MHELMPWLHLISGRRKRLVNGALLILLTLLAGVALLSVSGWFITASALTGLLLAAGLQASLNIYVPGGSIRLFAVTRTVSRYLERVYNHNTVLQLLADIRVRVFQGLTLAPLGVRADRSGASWLNRFTNDVDTLNTLYLRLVAPTAMALLASLAVVGLVWLLGSATAALALAGLLAAAFVVASVALYARTRHSAADQVIQTEQLRQATVGHIEGQAELIAAGIAGHYRQNLLLRAERYTGVQERLDRDTGWHLALTNGLVQLASVVVFWFGLELFQSGEISGPVAVLMPLAVLGSQEALAALPDAFGQLGSTVMAARRLNEQSEIMEPSVAVDPTPGSTGAGADTLNNNAGPVLVFDAVSIDQGTDLHQQAIDNPVSLTLEAGAQIGIIGPSGCGKSTLASLAAGLQAPQRGRCALAGREPTRFPAWDWLNNISYLTQSTELLDDTVRANLLLANTRASDYDLWRMLEVVDLADLLASLPHGLDTRVGAYGRHLSGGEGRRLALARALLKPSSLIILDEPFTGVDTATRERIKERLAPVLSGRTLLALGHSAHALPRTDRTVSMTTPDQ